MDLIMVQDLVPSKAHKIRVKEKHVKKEVYYLLLGMPW